RPLISDAEPRTIAVRPGSRSKAHHRKKEKRQPFSIAERRVSELTRLFRSRYGTKLTDDDAGRDDAFVMVSHLVRRPDAVRRMRAWLDLWCPWMSAAGAGDRQALPGWRRHAGQALEPDDGRTNTARHHDHRRRGLRQGTAPSPTEGQEAGRDREQ